jgi:hypothetical protein
MKGILVSIITTSVLLWGSGSAWAYAHANRWGGGTVHTFGATSHVSALGTQTTHVAGVGTAHTNVYGGTTARGYYGGAVHVTPYGGAAYRPPDRYYGYHPPTTVNYYGAHCYDCGSGWATAGAAVAGAAVGAAAGAAAASSGAAAATTGAYAAGVAAGQAAAMYSTGQIVATLPGGCTSAEVQGSTYYVCGNSWFRPAYGANGVYYTVVPTP